MLDERELAEFICSCLPDGHGDDVEDCPAFNGAETDGLPESEAGFQVTLTDGTRFVVVVTKVEEGE